MIWVILILLSIKGHLFKAWPLGPGLEEVATAIG